MLFIYSYKFLLLRFRRILRYSAFPLQKKKKFEMHKVSFLLESEVKYMKENFS
jgi:hypothetical protein